MQNYQNFPIHKTKFLQNSGRAAFYVINLKCFISPDTLSYGMFSPPKAPDIVSTHPLLLHLYQPKIYSQVINVLYIFTTINSTFDFACFMCQTLTGMK